MPPSTLYPPSKSCVLWLCQDFPLSTMHPATLYPPSKLCVLWPHPKGRNISNTYWWSWKWRGYKQGTVYQLERDASVLIFCRRSLLGYCIWQVINFKFLLCGINQARKKKHPTCICFSFNVSSFLVRTHVFFFDINLIIKTVE